jgi:hypothetical protein
MLKSQVRQVSKKWTVGLGGISFIQPIIAEFSKLDTMPEKNTMSLLYFIYHLEKTFGVDCI